MDLGKELMNKNEDEYGSLYKEHCLQIYLMYVEMADRISARRQTANSFFLSLNTVLSSVVGYVQLGGIEKSEFIFRLILSLAGMIICYTWYRLIRSYKDHNSGKFKVIHQMERQLPLKTYDAEWTALGRGKDSRLYLQFTKIEMRVPFIFFIIYAIVLFLVIPWNEIIDLFV